MNQQERDSKKRIAFPIQLFAEGSADVQIPDIIQVVPVGKWDHPGYGEMEITSAHIAEFARNFKDKVRLDIPINAGHDNGMSGGELPAIGWFTDVEDRGVNGLWAGVKWTEEGMRLLQARAFKYFSPEFYQDYEDPETRKKHGHVLVGGALTNKPYFKELEPVVSFSEPTIIHQFTDDMNLKDIVSKKPEDLSVEEKAFVRDHKSELSVEEATALASVLDGAGETDEEKAAREAKEAEEKAAADEAAAAAKAEAERQASEKNSGKKILMSEAEANALRDMADKGAKAFAEVEKMKLNEEVQKLVLSEGNKESRILPKQKDAVVAFMFSLDSKQRDQFRNILSNLPKMDTKLFSEVGDGGKTEGGDIIGVAAKVRSLATEKMKASEGLTYGAAVVQLFAEQPELKTEYEAALAETK